MLTVTGLRWCLILFLNVKIISQILANENSNVTITHSTTTTTTTTTNHSQVNLGSPVEPLITTSSNEIIAAGHTNRNTSPQVQNQLLSKGSKEHVLNLNNYKHFSKNAFINATTLEESEISNRLRDKINENELNDNFKIRIATESTTMNLQTTTKTVFKTRAHAEESSTGTDSDSEGKLESSEFFKRMELQESLSHELRQKLLLHRRKRYLLFPEGSSFQLVFDLIIGIVDYTSFAILGITCAAAYELPSKPPSEIFEEFQDKVNYGNFGFFFRRNDSIGNDVKYIDSNKEQVSTPTGTGTPIAGQAPNAIPAYYEQPSMTSAYRLQSPSSATSMNSYRPLNYYNSYPIQESNQRTQYPSSSLLQNPYSKYYTNINGVSSEKRTFPDWQQHTETRTRYGERTGNGYKTLPPVQQVLYSPQNTNWDKREWWRQNKQREENSWRKKQSLWTQGTNGFRPSAKSAVSNYPSISAFRAREGRNRRILVEPPKHHIYPVFGRRRRRRRQLDASELRLERIHLREHLQSRQKVFGKIEKLFQTRGLNGTACVLRALCETGQRQHQTEPQTFITELLRAIFALPKDLGHYVDDVERLEVGQANIHVASHFREAHAYTRNCTQNYYLCEHSIWE